MTPEPEDDAAGVASAAAAATDPNDTATSPYASSSASDNEDGDVSEMAEDQNDQSSNGGAKAKTGTSNGTSTAAANAKDPTRPRRKKARRACFACQRAHLTCGDERPCQRCVKRGLQDSCQDGMRKKAKYLHDAPNEALMPGIPGNHFARIHNVRANALSGNTSSTDIAPVVGQQAAFYPGNQPGPTSSYGLYNAPQSQPHMPPPLQDFGSQQPPISPPMHSGHSQQSSLSGLPGVLPQQGQSSNQGQNPGQPFGEPLFDPSNPAFFNFDLASLNFGNRYGAMEFGMLNHMSSGANDPSSGDSGGAMGQNAGGFIGGPSVYGQNPGSGNYIFGQEQMDWQGGNGSRHGSTGTLYKNGGDMPGARGNPNISHGYTIGAASLTSPSSGSSPQGLLAGFDGSPISSFYTPSSRSSQQQQQQQTPSQQNQQNQHNQQQQQQQQPQPIPHQQSQPQQQPHSHQQQQPPQLSHSSSSQSQVQAVQRSQGPRQTPYAGQNQRPQNKRLQGPSSIYETVKQPYSYTAGFHGLTACLQRRFSPQKTLRIAKALASIRPSFISSTKNLNREDLVFMEKCFQRTLWEYENDFINACGTPTIVCRRTGEVAAVGKEFSLLTGWKKDILLGKEANLNTNTGGSSGRASAGTSSSRGFNTPRVPEIPRPEGLEGGSRPQPVFLAELLDDDSVIDFYEDFSKLAFGDSRGSVTHRCKLLRYKTKEETSISGLDHDGNVKIEEYQMRGRGTNGKGNMNSIAKKGGAPGAVSNGSRSETASAINGLASQDGKVECSYCWTVKRDVFDIPMLIVMNVSCLPYLHHEIDDHYLIISMAF
ncbi:MAG: Transcriptional regulator of nonfermentable carbon utilization [Chaenotheca gracillima]|nr:MAG: Transcriptional regulator of nonfermentable carbon utilization [Chaenotheca gracillima]